MFDAGSHRVRGVWLDGRSYPCLGGNLLVVYRPSNAGDNDGDWELIVKLADPPALEQRVYDVAMRLADDRMASGLAGVVRVVGCDVVLRGAGAITATA